LGAAQNDAMHAELYVVAIALTKLDEGELTALIGTSYMAPKIPSWLLARMTGAPERLLTGDDPDRPQLAERAH
jgi:hypothetical protein